MIWLETAKGIAALATIAAIMQPLCIVIRAVVHEASLAAELGIFLRAPVKPDDSAANAVTAAAAAPVLAEPVSLAKGGVGAAALPWLRPVASSSAPPTPLPRPPSKVRPTDPTALPQPCSSSPAPSLS
eukprot:CAMPEP_0172175866 /NCGR_PEP_ID=MMETSP1050-20130122/14477_1 /TAXON_ID=233186 /ORGANISM="Cryptomonas curvata, Strain CCAP979/52" /LENGTH=127 /DNA_ID=CAMNT_0012848039 /DNA_START=1527 /DNA_END=1908 /DNA_ORIENTATION=+